MTNVIDLRLEERFRLVEQAEEPTRLDLMRAALVDSEGLQKMNEPVALVGGILYADSIAWLYGAPASFKTFVALDLAGCVGTGENWQGTGPTRQGTVLYVVAEGVSGVRKRVRAWEKAMGTVMKNVKFLPIAVQASNAAEWEALIELAKELNPVLIVLDTQARVTVGMEENSATEMGKFVQSVERLRRSTGACILVVHHTGRGGEHMRGSIAMDGAATTMIKVTRVEEIIDIECVKQKDAPEANTLRLRLVPFETSAILSGTDFLSPSTVGSPATQKLMVEWWDNFETEWVSIRKLSEVTGVPRQTLWRRLNGLVNAHIAETKGEETAKRWRLRSRPAVPTVSPASQCLNGTQASTQVERPTVPPPYKGGTGGTVALRASEPIDDNQ